MSASGSSARDDSKPSCVKSPKGKTRETLTRAPIESPRAFGISPRAELPRAELPKASPRADLERGVSLGSDGSSPKTRDAATGRTQRKIDGMQTMQRAGSAHGSVTEEDLERARYDLEVEAEEEDDAENEAAEELACGLGPVDDDRAYTRQDSPGVENKILSSPLHSAYLRQLPESSFVQKPADWRADLPISLRDPGYPEERKYRFADFFGIIVLAFKWHTPVILIGVVSAGLHWYFNLHESEVPLIDPLVFKSIFLVFGFCLGFRNVRANGRMEEANNSLHEFLSCAWNIILLFPNDHRRKVSRALLQGMRETASYVHSISVRKHWWAAMIDSRPKHQDVSMAGSSARPLLLAALNMAEECVYILEPSRDGPYTMRRSFWALKMKMLDRYEKMVQMTFPAVSDRYAGLLDACLIVFGILLPFGLHSADVDLYQITHGGHIVLPAGFLRLVNCCVVLTVMTGLNALAQENEEPFGRDDEDVRVDAYLRLFEKGLRLYERKRLQVEDLLEDDTIKLKETGATQAEIEVWRHTLVCNDLLAHVGEDEFGGLGLEHARVLKKYLMLGKTSQRSPKLSTPLRRAGDGGAYGATQSQPLMARAMSGKIF